MRRAGKEVAWLGLSGEVESMFYNKEKRGGSRRDRQVWATLSQDIEIILTEKLIERLQQSFQIFWRKVSLKINVEAVNTFCLIQCWTAEKMFDLIKIKINN